MTQHLSHIASQFCQEGAIESIRPFGSGNINTTYLVSHASPSPAKFILQSINTHVFQQPELVMKNMHTICCHINNKRPSEVESGRKWLMPEVLQTTVGTDHYIDDQGNFWRAMSFIESAQTFDTIASPDQAKELGWALGTFHSQLSDLPTEKLADTLPGFHNTPGYLAAFHSSLKNITPPDTPEIDFCLKFIQQREGSASVLEDAKNAKKLFNRPIHGDPKVSNVMVDKSSGLAVSIIDLDTVKPGLIHYDIGDCLRSGCNPLGEQPELLETIYFDLDLCREILTGYQSQASQFLTEYDYDYLYDAVRLISFELGLRYFTDFLNGNLYFKTICPDQNLYRAMVQFKLTQNIESKKKDISSLIASIR